MTQQTNPKRHKHADLIHAWAEGAEIEWSPDGFDWYLCYTCSWHENFYRIKPKLVKKWKWVLYDNIENKLAFTNLYFATPEEFYEAYIGHNTYTVLQKIDATEKEMKAEQFKQSLDF